MEAGAIQQGMPEASSRSFTHFASENSSAL
jgi:hypothetical protein